MLRTPNQDQVPFETLALLAKNKEGGIDEKKAKALIKFFRPGRDGKLSKLEFVKSIDAVYKSIKLVREDGQCNIDAAAGAMCVDRCVDQAAVVCRLMRSS